MQRFRASGLEGCKKVRPESIDSKNAIGGWQSWQPLLFPICLFRYQGKGGSMHLVSGEHYRRYSVARVSCSCYQLPDYFVLSCCLTEALTTVPGIWVIKRQRKQSAGTFLGFRLPVVELTRLGARTSQEEPCEESVTPKLQHPNPEL